MRTIKARSDKETQVMKPRGDRNGGKTGRKQSTDKNREDKEKKMKRLSKQNRKHKSNVMTQPTGRRSKITAGFPESSQEALTPAVAAATSFHE